jgi:uncharacterized protein YicC (UPF0701 family)
VRKVNFDYANTCPEIDAAIRQAKSEIESFIDDILSDACGLLEKKQREALSESYAEQLYSNLEDAFEKARSSNEKMRDEADSQISDLKDEISNLEARVEQLEREAA